LKEKERQDEGEASASLRCQQLLCFHSTIKEVLMQEKKKGVVRSAWLDFVFVDCVVLFVGYIIGAF
jgi:hypothetical protein